MGQREVETEVQRGDRTAIAIAAGALLCLVMLAVVEQKPCTKPETQKLGNSPVWDYCGTEREREAVNE